MLIPPLGRVFVVGAVLGLGSSVLAQVYGGEPHTYYLHRGSTYQQGCFGLCDCALSNRVGMVGSFTFTLANIGNATDFYTISQVNWIVPSLSGDPVSSSIITVSGGGTLGAGQQPSGNSSQHTVLDLSIIPAPVGGRNPYHFDNFDTRTIPPPVIAINNLNSTNPNTGCPVHLQIVASTRRSDWNGDNMVSVQDLFDFLGDYFQNRADYNGDGLTTVGDLFAFLGDWFAGA